MRDRKILTRRTRIWIIAARPRTLALALATVGMGTALTVAETRPDWLIALLTFVTAVLLQILSNLANDYGDSIHGADRDTRVGPKRTVQSGAISASLMRRAIATVALAAIISGLALLWIAFGRQAIPGIVVLGALGVLAIWAAITYTAGSMPYGYAGLGDIAVFIFFGWVGAVGSYVLQTNQVDLSVLLPATTIGLYAVAVLNVNNIRDLDSDRQAGKLSIPVRLGLAKARLYHWGLLVGGLVSMILFVYINYVSAWQFLFLLTTPLIVQNGWSVSTRPVHELDPFLRRMSLTTLLFVLTFGIGQAITY